MTEGRTSSAVAGAEYSDIQDSGTRRLRVQCKYCSTAFEVVRLREHLRTAHHLDSGVLESAYLEAIMAVRRSRRNRF